MNLHNNAYKEKSPEDTISKIREMTDALGLEMVVNSEKCEISDNYRADLKAYYKGQMVGLSFGKGTTEELCLASAYGEFVERLQNNSSYFDIQMISPSSLREQVMEQSGFVYSKDEILKGFEDSLAIDPFLSHYAKRHGRDILERMIDNEAYYSKGSLYAHVPLKALNGRGNAYLNMKAYNTVNGSTGLAAGNTLNEAIVQAISEILERDIQWKMVNGKLSPNRLSDGFLSQYPKPFRMIQEIREMGYGCDVFDLSFTDVPCLATAVTDPKTACYFIRIGVFPIFEVAFERSITEILQLNEMKTLFVGKSYLGPLSLQDENETFIKILQDDYGVYSERFFSAEEYSDNLSNKEIFLPPETTNEEMVRYYIRYFKERNLELYYFDSSSKYIASATVVAPALTSHYQHSEVKGKSDTIKFIFEMSSSIINRDASFFLSQKTFNALTNADGIDAFLEKGLWSLIPKGFRTDFEFYNHFIFSMLLAHGHLSDAATYFDNKVVGDEYSAFWPSDISGSILSTAMKYKIAGYTEHDISKVLNAIIRNEEEVRKHQELTSDAEKVIEKFLINPLTTSHSINRKNAIEEFYIQRNRVLFGQETEASEESKSIF